MLCEKCKKNNASLFYKETVNGKTTSFALCHECAKELENEGKISFSAPLSEPLGHFSAFGDIDDLFSGFFAPAKKAAQISEQKRCPLCAATFSDIANSGKVGCAKCYETFREELDHTIRSIHGNRRHIGRSSGPEKEKNEKQKKISALKTELKNAIAKEDFERAASLRDQIKEMEGEL